MSERLAHFMFVRQAMSYGALSSEMTEIWECDPGVRDFWLAEANSVLMFLEGFSENSSEEAVTP